MHRFTKISTAKILNAALFLAAASIVTFMHLHYKDWCQSEGIGCYYNFYDAFYNPLYFGGRILAVILGLMLFVPARFFVKWLLFLAVPMIAITYLLVNDISVYSSGILSMSRAQVAVYGMSALALFTALYIGGRFLYERKKT